MSNASFLHALLALLFSAGLVSGASAQALWSASGIPKSGTCDYTPGRGEMVQSCLTIDAPFVRSLAKGQSVRGLEIPVGGLIHVLHDVRVKALDEQTTTLFGRLDGEAFPTFHLAVHDGAAAGSFAVDGQLYEVRPSRDGASVLTKVDKSERRRLRDDAVIPEWMPKMPEMQQRARKGGVAAQIDMLLLWDDGVLSANGAAGLAALEASFVDYLNQTVANGGNPDIVFNVAHSEVIAYNENQFADMGDDLTAMADGSDGVLDEAHTLRTQHGADLVHLLLPSFKDDTCGIAYQSFTGANLGFGVTGVDGCGMETFAHEIGHNMGMGHDVYVSSEPQDAFQLWSYGYVDLNSAIHTVMAYSNQCFDNAINCDVVPFFSDPNARSNGVSLGVVDRPPNKAANNFRVLEETAENRAGFSDILDSCVADVYSGETGPTTAAQGEELSFAVNMARNSLSAGCTGDPSFAVYLTGTGFDTYLVGRQSVSLTETPQPYAITGTPSNPAPPTGTYSVLLYDDAGGGYYILDLEVQITAASGVHTEEEGLPVSVRLLSAYPNPFNPRASVTFETTGQQAISIRVYDTLGRERAVLVGGEKLTAGEHTVTFEAADLPSGTYLIRLEAGAHSDVLPITLLR